MKTKYIIVDSFGAPAAIVFPELLYHANVAKGQQVISAGFCHRNPYKDGWECYGMSTSLNIKSRPAEDTKILNSQIK